MSEIDDIINRYHTLIRDNYDQCLRERHRLEKEMEEKLKEVKEEKGDK